MSNFQLGQPVRYSHPLARIFTHDAKTGRKVWAPQTNYKGEPLIGRGIIIGKRTLANGKRHYIGYDEGIAFIPEEYFTAYLIAYDLARKPVYVRPEHIQAAS